MALSEETWNANLASLRSFVSLFSRMPSRTMAGPYLALARWCASQRHLRRAGRLSPERAELLNAVPMWMWDEPSPWGERLEMLRLYVAENGHTPPAREVVQGFKLGLWCSSQRHRHKHGRLAPERAELLDAMPQWEWNTRRVAGWNDRFELLRSYMAERGRCPTVRTVYQDFNIGWWCNEQRRDQRTSTMLLERIDQLNALPLWEWNAREDTWVETFEVLQSYMAVHGRCPLYDAKHKGVNIGHWARDQRRNRRRLTAVHEERLNSLPGWRW